VFITLPLYLKGRDIMSRTAEDLYHEYEHYATETLYRMYENPNNIAKSHRIEFEDMLQFAKIGLYNACLSYDPSKAKFSTYAINTIKYAVKTSLNRETRIFKYNMNKAATERDKYQLLSCDENIKGTEGDLTLHDLIGNGYVLEDDAANREYVRYIEDNIEPDILEMIKMKSKNVSLSKIGEKFGLSGERIRQKIVSVRKQLETAGWEAI
jgi:RNA polymerase sigma factor (sigma-70 family)